jgi:hypothetical protein
MANSQDTAERAKKDEQADASAYRKREDAGPKGKGIEQTIEVAARLYYDFCRRAARTVSRLKREDD